MAQAPTDMAETNRSNQDEPDVKRYKLSFNEIREETFQTEKQVWNKKNCDICFLLDLSKITALFLCSLCQQYVCRRCNERHDQSHRMIEIESKRGERGERDEQIEGFLDELKNESDNERKVMFDREKVSVVDRVNVKHELDKSDRYRISGLCGLDDTRWVVCDYHNHCIKIFSIGSHILQRYIRFSSEPYGVTEIRDTREPTEQGIISTTDISVPNPSKPNKQCILAVTLPEERRILFINLTCDPAIITKSIKTEKQCGSIEFRGNKIYSLCQKDYPRGGPWFVSVMSTDGVTIQTIDTPLCIVSDLAVCPGRFYLTDWVNHTVLCMNDEGEVVYHKTIEGSRPEGISVDPDNNNIYICAGVHHTVYRLDSRLESFESLVDLKSVKSEEQYAICVYRDRLYVGHGLWSTDDHLVTVIRVL